MWYAATTNLHKDKPAFTCIITEWIHSLFVPNDRRGFNIQRVREHFLEFLAFCAKFFDCFFCYRFVTVSVAFTRIEWKVRRSETLNHSRMLHKKERMNSKLRSFTTLLFVNHFRIKKKTKFTSRFSRTTQHTHSGQGLLYCRRFPHPC
jgi:hypothetical protein